MLASKRRDTVSARRFFTNAIRDHGQPSEVATVRAAALAKAIGELAVVQVRNRKHTAVNSNGAYNSHSCLQALR